MVSEVKSGMCDKDNKHIHYEIELLLNALYHSSGYDFREYARASLKRRLLQRLANENLQYLSQMLPLILYDSAFQHKILMDLSINVTDMFRDPDFFLALRKDIIPILKTYPFVNIWHAGCATGEEVYSMAIILAEEGFYDKVNIYATDCNAKIIQEAKQGIYPVHRIQQFTENYHIAGGRHHFSKYYHSKYQQAKIDEGLKKNIIFASHNLVSDHIFAKMQLIICRNVMIYFNQTLKDKVLQLFFNSLTYKGFLCLGKKETLNFSNTEACFTPYRETERIYQKK